MLSLAIYIVIVGLAVVWVVRLLRRRAWKVRNVVVPGGTIVYAAKFPRVEEIGRVARNRKRSDANSGVSYKKQIRRVRERGEQRCRVLNGWEK